MRASNIRKIRRLNNRQHKGSAVFLATTAIIVVGTGLVMAQLASSKFDTKSTVSAQVNSTGALQGATLAAAAGVSVVNNLSSSGTCAASSGCSTGIYGVGVLSGGAAKQSSSWWSNSSNVRSYTYPGFAGTISYVIEQLSCDTSSGLTVYRVTARAATTSTKTGLQGKNIVWYSATANKTWAPTTNTVTFYDYSCDATSYGYSPYSVSFVTAAGGNLSPYNSNRPYAAFSSGSANITQVEAGIGNWSQSTNLQITISVNGSQVYTGTLSSGPMSNRGYSKCSSGNNMSVFVLPSPIAVTPGQTVGISFGSGSGAIHRNTTGKSPGNNNSSQMRYRIIGTQSVNNCPVAS
ncbi:MAG: hypothetical protein RLZ35_23 [Pseudomonadota bacterium]|jgi:hypothetical protein